ncbi:MAG: hypothetical protein ACT4QC_19495 [Planctomycetaceae bacterium]
MSDGTAMSAATPLAGLLHVFVAFDWGDEIDLERAARLAPATRHELPRRVRTPPSIAYQSPPLRVQLAPVELTLPAAGATAAAADVVLFDFGAVGMALHAPLDLSSHRWLELAGELADPTSCVRAARTALEGLYEKLRPAVKDPDWSELSEEYFVFQLAPTGPLFDCQNLFPAQAGWLAGLVRLEPGPLSAGEIAEATRLRLSYSPNDMIVADWAAAVVIDRECDEILEALAFANLQLLEFRHIDGRLDERLKTAYGLIHDMARRWLPFWRSHARPLRDLGELNAEVNEMLERATSAFTLVGDPYLARVYQLLVTRLHLDDWGSNIRQSIAVLEGIYRVLSDQAATYRTEALEIAIVALIVVEIALTLLGH